MWNALAIEKDSGNVLESISAFKPERALSELLQTMQNEEGLVNLDSLQFFLEMEV